MAREPKQKAVAKELEKMPLATYYAKRSVKGTKDRNGKPLSDFMRGVYAGKAKQLIKQGKNHSYHSKKNSK